MPTSEYISSELKSRYGSWFVSDAKRRTTTNVTAELIPDATPENLNQDQL